MKTQMSMFRYIKRLSNYLLVLAVVVLTNCGKKEDESKQQENEQWLKSKNAIVGYREAISIYPESDSIYLNWGIALSKLGRGKEAIEKYKKALEIDSLNVVALAYWGDELFFQRKYDEAIAKYRQATEIDANKTNVYQLWHKSVKQIRISKPELYEQEVKALKKALKKVKTIKGFEETEDFREVYESYFPPKIKIPLIL